MAAAGQSLHHKAVELLGHSIVTGTTPAGSVMLAEELEVRLNVSRSVVREAIRVLASMGLVESVKRVGIRVQPQAEWDPFDPNVIRWRMESSSRGAQLRSLAELRFAIEPVASELAALNAPAPLKAELVAVATDMIQAGHDGELEVFLGLDVRFHHLVLVGSGNEMFARVSPQIAETLAGRTHHGLMPEHPKEVALGWHMDVARAISEGRGAAARNGSAKIIRETISDLCPIWEDQPRVFMDPQA